MRPFLISIGITAGQFAVLTFAWFMADRLSPQGLFLILWAFLLAGPMPYLAYTYVRQQRFDILTQALTYLSGHGVLLLTLGYVWQCRIQVLKIGIPFVVNDPPWMTTLMFGYIATAGALSYLMVLMSGRKPPKDPSNIYLAPSHITNPLLRGVLRTASDARGDQSK